MHAIQTETRGKQLHDFVKNCDNDLYKVYLSSAIKPDDALSIDVQYHRTCWTKHVVRTTDNCPQLESTVEKENEIAANTEFLNLIEHENKTVKIQGGLKGLTQQPAAMARWFLIAPELSRLAAEAEALVGIQAHSSTHHHDLSTAVITRFDENAKKLKEVFKGNDPFANEETELVNIITKAVMPEPVKDAVLTRDQVDQEHFSNFVKEKIVERKLSVWSPMKKVNLQTWKTTRATKKSKTASSVAALKDDRALFARFIVVVLSRPEIDHQGVHQ